MNDFRQETIDTYNKSAKQLAEYFRDIRSRKQYVDIAIEAAGNPPNPQIVELGCGDGRDAKYITTRTSNYIGFDVSSELIKLARQHVPGADFRIADAVNFSFPPDLDVIFAFASLLHLDKAEVKQIFSNAADALRSGGIFYISTKYRTEYESEVKEDEFGRRLFYFYNQELFTDLAGESYRVVKGWHEIKGHTDWLELILRRK